MTSLSWTQAEVLDQRTDRAIKTESAEESSLLIWEAELSKQAMTKPGLKLSMTTQDMETPEPVAKVGSTSHLKKKPRLVQIQAISLRPSEQQHAHQVDLW